MVPDGAFVAYDVHGNPISPAGVDTWALPGTEFQDFSVIPPPRTFPNCRLPLLSWRLGPCCDCGPYGTQELPVHAVRKARWYTSDDLVLLRRDGHDKQIFARRGTGALPPRALSTSEFDYPLDAGGQFLLGHRFTEHLSLEATYLGSFEWNTGDAVRSNNAITVGGLTGTGILSSPFTGFGNPAVIGLDFNNFVNAETRANLESFELMFRYRPDNVPYGPFDVSALYGLRYIHVDEDLHYHSESGFPAGGSINDVNVATDNDLIGAQLGLTMHFLILPRFWFDWDIRGGLYNNHARQRTIYQNIDSTAALTSFANVGGRDDTSGTLDIKVISNYQLLQRLTLRFGYQATFLTSAATAVSNFPTNLDIVRFGPGQIDTTDTVTYHGPVLGITWVR